MQPSRARQRLAPLHHTRPHTDRDSLLYSTQPVDVPVQPSKAITAISLHPMAPGGVAAVVVHSILNPNSCVIQYCTGILLEVGESWYAELTGAC
jgi:hypothetical protein